MNPILKLFLDGAARYLQNNPAEVEKLIAAFVQWAIVALTAP